MQASAMPVATSSSDVLAVTHRLFTRHIQFLHKHYNRLLHRQECAPYEYNNEVDRKITSVRNQIGLLENLVFKMYLSRYFLDDPRPGDVLNLINYNEPSDKQRYLCISNGFVIWCLDLKPNNKCDATWEYPPPPVVKFAELKLENDLFPVSVGLFNWQSNAYMIGGMGLEAPEMECKGNCDPQCDDCYTIASPRPGIQLYKSHVETCFTSVEGSSLGTCRLSVDAETRRLLYSECDDSVFKKLNKPKLWPIVEEIDGCLHVLDSRPKRLPSDMHAGLDRMFSHEVLINKIWKEIPPIEVDEEREGNLESYYIKVHTVVGKRIYAISDCKQMVFESETWQVMERDYGCDDPFTVKNVWNILELGMARCVAEFPVQGRDPLYLLLAVMELSGGSNGYSDLGTISLAYLVTSAGDVVCYQRTSTRPRVPAFMYSGTIIKVDDKETNTMCVIVSGEFWGDDKNPLLFIDFVSMEVRSQMASKVGRIWEQGRECGWPVELDFVKIVFKDSYTFRNVTSEGEQDGAFAFCSLLRACLVSN